MDTVLEYKMILSVRELKEHRDQRELLYWSNTLNRPYWTQWWNKEPGDVGGCGQAHFLPMNWSNPKDDSYWQSVNWDARLWCIFRSDGSTGAGGVVDGDKLWLSWE